MADPTNSEIAAAFDELGDLYELDGAIIHRVVAYRNAAKVVRDASVSVAALTRDGRVTELPGIGATLETKLVALVETGDIPQAARLRAKFPAGLLEMTRLPGLGPKRARRLYEELGVDSLQSLETAARQQRIRDLKGFGVRAEENFLAAIARANADAADGKTGGRFVLDRALAIAEPLLELLRAHPTSHRVELAGSARRWADSVKDLDIIATADDPRALAEALTASDLVESIAGVGDAGARVRTHSGMGVDLKVVAPDQFGNLLQHFSGSKEHNMALREAAVKRGLHVSEYGVLDDATGETLRCATEQEVYAELGYAYIEPELRENRGELRAALLDGGSGLPELIREEDVRGDLHSHTTASDGRNEIEEMAEAAQALGYEYLAITDHSASHGFGDEVSAEQLEIQIERIHAANAAFPGIELLAGSEVNIMPDGSLDYPDELLARLDWVIASVHSSFRIDERAMTERVVAAIEHPWVDAIGHLTGRKIEARPPYAIDVERVIEAAARTGTMLEINAAPDRRDLNDVHARAAAQAGVRILVNSDAHRTRTLASSRRYGIATARRAWLTAEQVANTRGWAQFAPLRKRAGTVSPPG
ncbi:DNA polymerase/3'-5' exonuclease PolX [Conexibacter woesei]|uniref:DNA-directed DNA polymerase n=1 Tax=Conexibacter woesei (strain DSM 14684 / CCUG 47730 / CIP 108061 / JCM 11494 / NBRC 100937 / ID131577) TaxID=469383 RepID=D3F2V8_CONWI|nr:DNA polymerase/3'-5' exonuclease PolX [Conexibacter woesei]ADB54239.1 PHP domain protein [Conexibacter woesei DSM 14684]